MSARRGPRSVADRLRRLLVMLPWLMERRTVPVEEMAEHFGLTEAELVRDLELAALCGLPPFLDEMIDVFIDEGMVVAGVPRVFVRPLRLTAPEGFALLASSRLALETTGVGHSDALDRALGKLEAVLGDVAVVVDEPAPPVTAVVSAAAERCERLDIAYRTAGGDVVTERTVTPRQVFTDRGNWYVVADDHRSGEERIFRLDRVERCTPTGELDEPREVQVPRSGEWFLGTDLPVVELRLGSASSWVMERYPTRSLETSADGWRVGLTVAREDWLATLLLRLGTDAEVVSPGEWRGLGADAARAVLERYDAGGSAAS